VVGVDDDFGRVDGDEVGLCDWFGEFEKKKMKVFDEKGWENRRLGLWQSFATCGSEWGKIRVRAIYKGENRVTFCQKCVTIFSL